MENPTKDLSVNINTMQDLLKVLQMPKGVTVKVSTKQMADVVKKARKDIICEVVGIGKGNCFDAFKTQFPKEADEFLKLRQQMAKIHDSNPAIKEAGFKIDGYCQNPKLAKADNPSEKKADA